MSERLHLNDARFHVIEEPKKYDSFKDSFIINIPEPHKFLPDSYLKHFDSLLFYNFVHRECFRSSIKNTSNIESSEVTSYKNCVAKHQHSIKIFSKILLSSRKWQGFMAYINLREYHRHPEEMGTTLPTNPIVRKNYLDLMLLKENHERGRGIQNLLRGPQKPKPLNFVYEYLIKKKGIITRLDLEQAIANKNVLEEYNRLNQVFGGELAEELKSTVDIKDWKGIPGDDFVPEESDAGSE